MMLVRLGWSLVLALSGATACILLADPLQRTTLTVEASTSNVSDSLASEARALIGRISIANGLSASKRPNGCEELFVAQDPPGPDGSISPRQYLEACLIPRTGPNQLVIVRVSHQLGSSKWSPHAQAYLRDLRDSLRAVYGAPAVVETRDPKGAP
jgi:hypothetical protein